MMHVYVKSVANGLCATGGGTAMIWTLSGGGLVIYDADTLRVYKSRLTLMVTAFDNVALPHDRLITDVEMLASIVLEKR